MRDWGHGTCFDCGKKIKKRFKYCDDCRSKRSREYDRENYQLYKSLGICTKCKHRPIAKGSEQMCDVCLKKMRERAKKRALMKKKEFIENATM